MNSDKFAACTDTAVEKFIRNAARFSPADVRAGRYDDSFGKIDFDGTGYGRLGLQDVFIMGHIWP